MKTATLEDVEMIVAARLADLERRIAPEALSVRDVCQRLKLGPTRVRELIRAGELPSYLIGSARRVDPSDLAAFIADHRKASAPTPAASRPHVARRSSVSWLADLQREAYGE